MIKKLKTLFAPQAPAAKDSDLEPVQHAAASLLVQAALLDGSLDAEEETLIGHLLARRFSLSEDSAAALVKQAREHAQDSVEMYGLTRDLKNALNHEERVQLMEMLWQVAYADGELHHYESNLMRRIAGLIYVSDRESAEARKRALRSMGLME